MRTIVTTCGTSLLTNAHPDRRRWLIDIANARETELAPADREMLDRLGKEVAERLRAADRRQVRRLSAELNGLLARFPALGAEPVRHLLITTDTHPGRLCADLLEDWLRAGGGVGTSVEVLQPTDLRTRSAEELRWGLAELAGELAARLGEVTRPVPDLHFNLSGGFKSINGFLQALAAIYGAEVFYIFEGGGEAMVIPPLPLRLEEEMFARHAALFRALDLELRVPADELRRAGLAGSLWVEADGQAALTPWGKTLWHAVQQDFYARDLLPPPWGSPIAYSERLRADAQKLDRVVRRALSRRVDQLAQLLAGAGANLHGLDLKELRGDLRPPATHQFDVTHTHGAFRGFGHFEVRDDGRKWFVIDAVERHA